MRKRAEEDGMHSEFIFVSDLDVGTCKRGSEIDPRALNHYLNHVMGYPKEEDAGFRRTFRTWGGETGSGSKERENDLEMCLGHIIGDKTRNVYAEYVERIEPRRKILQDYANFADGLITSATVLPFIKRTGEMTP
jgi:hypothetical protein